MHPQTVGSESIERLGGMYCNEPVRRLAVYNYLPGSLHYKDMNVMLNQGTAFDALDAAGKTAWMNDQANYSQVAWRRYQSPTNHWVVPMVPDKKYRITWGSVFDYDFERIRFEVTQYLWGNDVIADAINEGDFDIDLPFRDYREGVTVSTEDSIMHADLSRLNALPNPSMGGNDFVNPIDNPPFSSEAPPFDAAVGNPPNVEKMVKLIVSGDTEDVNWVEVTVQRCIIPEDCEFVTDISYGTIDGAPCGLWSAPSTWTGQFETERIPVEGDYVRIPLGTCVVIDIDECAMPQLKFLEVNGLLRALNDPATLPNMALKAFNIWIRAGELRIGESPADPHLGKFTIMLLGDSKAYNWAFHGAIEVGNKAMVVTGLLNLHGNPR